MCGIAAIISNKKIEKTYIERMLAVIQHRGPDNVDCVYLNDGNIALGHRRLSILDLSEAGNQPMSYLSGRYWITYNGEIYNYIELRKELELKGYRFLSNTDTEVIMAAYDCWGAECLHKFNGMWAFVIVDTVKKVTFVARDRFGVKPFYFYKDNNTIFISSEIKQILEIPEIKVNVNQQRAYDYLCWGVSDHTNETLFKNIYQLRPGEAGIIDFDKNFIKCDVYKWYNLQFNDFYGSFDEAIEEFKYLFFDAVKLRLRSDVQIGSCLSGGLDSSSIVCAVNYLLKQENKEDYQKTVSAVSDVSKYDERQFINEVLKSKCINGYFTLPDFDTLFKSVDKITWHQDEPFGSTSIFAQWCVFDAAANNNLKVMLDGQGADEQLAGYHTFFKPRFAGLFKTFQWIKLLDEISACKKLHNYSVIFALKGIMTQLLPDFMLNEMRKHYNHVEIAPEWIDLEKLQIEPQNLFTNIGTKVTTIRDLSISQLTCSNLQRLLHYEDRNSMAHSVESRLPFLDNRLVEFVLGLPDEYKLSNGITKRVLRESMRNYMPEKVCNRIDKIGFATPEEVWVRNYSEVFRKKLSESIEISNGILNKKALSYFDNVINKKIPFSFTIWRMINFGIWMKIFRVS